jgi:hypothetical protein
MEDIRKQKRSAEAELADVARMITRGREDQAALLLALFHMCFHSGTFFQ